jgi:predicted nucleotidyltransferase
VSLAAWSGLPGITSAYADHPGGAEVDEARLAAICNRHSIAELKIFDSQARGTAQPGSDILYTLQPGHWLGWEIEQLADELAELFSGRVDLVSARALHPLLRPSVLAEARPVYAA